MIFTIPPNKDYKQDISILQQAIQNGENISFSKFCDGEWAVLQNQPINNKEFWFDPNNEEDQKRRQLLLEAFQYQNERYFVGVTCVNVFGIDTHRKMKELSGQPEERLTWADIWVNSNYRYYLENVLPLFQTRPVILFCNYKAKTENLPFVPYLHVPVQNNAWETNANYIEDINSMNFKNMIFLFCCGPFGNILCHQFTKHNPDNIYLDIGSTLNPFIQSAGFERDYYLGHNYFSNMIGSWDQ